MASKLSVITEKEASPATRTLASVEWNASPLARAFAQASAPRPVLIAALFYRHADLARRLCASLLRCADELRALDAEVLLVNDSPDDPQLAAALDEVALQIGDAFAWRIVRNPSNLGFVGSCNRVIAEAVDRGMDVLLLNSDTLVVPGAIGEMVRVSRLDPMIGFVNPRSNNATLATLPYQDRFRDASPAQAEAGWRALAGRLPELSYVPTAVGFCLLIRWSILAEFGGFDEIYGRGYNEENDLIMRAGRRGYRAVLANHAFVWHEGSTSFGRSDEVVALEARNRDILLARYPEYTRLTADYFDSAEQRAEILLGALLPDEDGRIDVALDFSTFTSAHNGTSIAGEQLLAAAAELWGDRYRLHVLASPEVYDFHDYGRYGAPRCDPHGPEVFAAVFRVGQPFDWNTLERLIMKAATIGVFMLDTISMDCAELTSQKLSRYWSFVLEHLDLLAVTSELTSAQIERRLPIGADVKRARSLHSLDLADYRLPVDGAAAPAPPGFLFVVGNHFWHKEVAATVNALAEADPERTIVVLAGPNEAPAPADDGLYAPSGIKPHPNVLRLCAGELSHEEIGAVYRDAAAIVFPSHYEGFGIPLLNALAAKKPVLIRPLPVFAEMVDRIGEDPNIHVFETTADLVRRLEQPLHWREHGAVVGRPGDARRAARDVGEALDVMVAGARYERIVRRVRALKTLQDFSAIHPAQLPPGDSKAFIAASIGHAIEALSRRLLDVPGILPISRACYRGLRRLGGARDVGT